MQIVFGIFLLIGNLSFAGNATSVKEAFKKFDQAKIEKNYSSWSNYILPEIVKNWGGKSKVEAGLKRLTEKSTTSSKYLGSEIEHVKKFTTCGHLQCAVFVTSKLTSTAKHGDGKIFNKVLAMVDRKNHWYFVELDEALKDDLIKRYPLLKSELGDIKSVGKFHRFNDFIYVEFPEEKPITKAMFQSRFFD